MASYFGVMTEEDDMAPKVRVVGDINVAMEVQKAVSVGPLS